MIAVALSVIEMDETALHFIRTYCLYIYINM